MKKHISGLIGTAILLSTGVTMAAEGDTTSFWGRLPGSLLIAAAILILALAVFYRLRNSKNLKPALSTTSQPGAAGVTIVPATEANSKPKHGTEGVCCGSCSN